MRQIGFLVIIFLFLSSVSAQYHFTELGVRAGAGATVPFQDSYIKTGYGYNLNFFFSHYICGKKFGYHFEGGLHNQTVYEKQRPTAPSFFSALDNSPTTYNMLYADIGAMFKIRPKNYNRKTEVCFMLGPKGAFKVYAYSNKAGNTTTYAKDSYHTPLIARPGVAFNTWVRFPMGKSNSIFVIPGGDFYFLDAAKTSAGLHYQSFYLYINVGLTFWNNL